MGEFALQATSNVASALGSPTGTCLGKEKEEMNQEAGLGCWPQDCPTLSAGVWTLPTPPACLLGASLPQGQRINKLLLSRPTESLKPSGEAASENVAGATTWGTGGRRRGPLRRCSVRLRVRSGHCLPESQRGPGEALQSRREPQSSLDLNPRRICKSSMTLGSR